MFSKSCVQFSMVHILKLGLYMWEPVCSRIRFSVGVNSEISPKHAKTRESAAVCRYTQRGVTHLLFCQFLWSYVEYSSTYRENWLVHVCLFDIPDKKCDERHWKVVQKFGCCVAKYLHNNLATLGPMWTTIHDLGGGAEEIEKKN